MSLRRTVQKALNLRGIAHRCYVCNAKFSRFLPYRKSGMNVAPFLSVLGVVGSDMQNFACPVCRCTDRDRHLCMYFDALDLWGRFGGANILHFAPEVALIPRISATQPVRYVRADLFPATADIERIDITAIPYADESFDVVICNHVLEHVPNDGLALSEIRRVLKHGGRAILQTPYSSVLHSTWEDSGIATEQQRLLCYGQEDHVRLYGVDLFEKIIASGLHVQRHSHMERLPERDASYYGVNPLEDLILAIKQ